MTPRNLFYISLFACMAAGCTAEFTGDGNDDGLFMKFYGGAREDFGHALIELPDGYALAGSTRSFGNGDSDLFLVITDARGNALESRAIGGDRDQSAKGLIRLGERLMTVGWTENEQGFSDIWLLETTLRGDSLRSWTYGNPTLNETGVDLQTTSDGGLVITATRYTASNVPDTYLLKLDDEMNVVWENNNALNNLSDQFGKNIVENGSNEVIYCSTSKRSTTGHTDIRVTSINALGELAWNAYYGDNTTNDEAHAIIQHAGFLYVLGNTRNSESGDTDIAIVRTNRSGTSSEIMTLGMPGMHETGKQLVSLKDGSLLVVGERKLQENGFSDIYVERISPNGNVLWDEAFSLGGQLDDIAADALETATGDLVICGTASFSGNPVMLLVKLSKDGKLKR